MPGGALQVVQAVVVGGLDYGERDRVVRLLTAEHGRISAMAHNARGSRRRFGAALDLGQRVEAVLRPGKGELWHLDSARTLDSSLALHGDMGALALVAYSCELVSSLAQESSPEPRLHGLLATFLGVLESAFRQGRREGSPPEISCLRPALEAKALTYAGLTPVLLACCGCGGPLQGTACFDPGSGGALHPSCGAGQEVDTAFLAHLERCRRTRLAELVGVPLPPGPPWLLARPRS